MPDVFANRRKILGSGIRDWNVIKEIKKTEYNDFFKKNWKKGLECEETLGLEKPFQVEPPQINNKG